MASRLAWIGLIAAMILTGCRGLPGVGSVEAVDLIPALAPRSSQSVRAPGRIIYIASGQVMEWSDGASRPLTRPGVRYEGPAWSPDGKLIAVSEVGDNHSDLVLLDQAGARVRQLTEHWSKSSVQDSAWARRPAWTPDGRSISYVSDQFRTDMSLWTVSPQGGGTNRRSYTLAKGSGGLDWPAWSPDGRRVAFVAYPSGPYQPPQIWVFTPATGAIAQITDLKDGAFDPAWSPDGTMIAFAGRGDGKTRIMAMKPDGTGMIRLTDGRADRAPAWSPDGSEIAFLSLNHSSFDVFAARLSAGSVTEPRQLTSGQNADAVSGLSWVL